MESSKFAPRFYDYFITVHESAECFYNIQSIISNINPKFYAYILHNKDINIQTNLSTPIHYHIVLELKNAKTFSAVQKLFKGAHIELMKFKVNSYRYLLHNTPDSVDKYEYDISSVITSDLLAYKRIIDNPSSFRVFVEEQFMYYIAEDINTPYRFVKVFGFSAYKTYYSTYKDLLHELTSNQEMQNELELIKEEMFNNDLPF